jgi:hypothetical protein
LVKNNLGQLDFLLIIAVFFWASAFKTATVVTLFSRSVVRFRFATAEVDDRVGNVLLWFLLLFKQ